MNSIANRTVMCQVLSERASHDSNLMVLCSDSRGSASMGSFAELYPLQFVETGIAEQDLVGIASGLAACGYKAYAISPASFITSRSFDQVRVDCAYSGVNVKLVGISGGISYGALGLTHHSVQDIAMMSATPGMRVYIPSDRFQTRKLFEALLEDEKPAYIRLGRGPVEDIYSESNIPFIMDRATVLRSGGQVLLVACGEMVRAAIDAADILVKYGISCSIIDAYSLKPFDSITLLEEARGTDLVVTIEEHSQFGGVGAIVSQILGRNHPEKVLMLSLPDTPVIAGSPKEVFSYYGLDSAGIAESIKKELTR